MSGIFGGGGGGGQQSTNTVTNQPPAYLEPYLTTAAGNSQNAYNQYVGQGLNNPFSGALPANIGQLTPQATPNDINAQNTDLSVANSIAGNMTNTNGIAQNLQSNIASGMFQAPSNMTFQPMSDQDLAGSIASQIAPLQRTLTEQTLPGLTSQAIQQGAYGGSRQGVVQDRALNDFSTAATNATADATEKFQAQNALLSEQNLANRISAGVQGNQQVLSADAEIPSLQQTAEQQGLDVANLQSGVGAAQRGFTSADIAAAMQNYAGQQAAPYGGLGMLESLLMGTASGGTSTSSVPQPGLLSQVAGGLGSLGGFASALGGAGSLFNSGAAAATGLPWLSSGSGLSGIGSSASALMSLFA